MEAYGSDGNIVANETHLTITWTSLRGRLSSRDRLPFETIPISRIGEVSVIPATPFQKGCFQVYLVGNPLNVNDQLDWISALHKGTLTHGVMFTLPAQFQFKAVAEHIQRQIYFLGKYRRGGDFNIGLASN
ncbi:MAG: hypothetical protein ACKN92_09565 [Candidatus Nanopelagicaceae bacterium]